MTLFNVLKYDHFKELSCNLRDCDIEWVMFSKLTAI